MRRSLRLLLGAASLALIAWGDSNFAKATDYFAGKTVTVIVGSSPTGGTTIIARIYVNVLDKYIPGNPKVILKNMPGAGTTKAQNWLFEKARKDGTIIGFNPFVLGGYLPDLPGIRFKYDQFSMIAGFRGPNSFAFANAKALPSKNPADLVKLRNFKYAGRAPDNVNDALGLAALELLGAKFTYVPGYRGPVKTLAAVQSDETQMGMLALQHWIQRFKPNLIPNGQMVGLWQFSNQQPDGSFKKHPSYGDLPSFQEVYKKVHGKLPSGQLWDALQFYMKLSSIGRLLVFGPPGMNPEAHAILSAAFEKANKDPEVVRLLTNLNGATYDLLNAKQATKALTKVANMDPKMAKFWADRIRARTK